MQNSERLGYSFRVETRFIGIPVRSAPLCKPVVIKGTYFSITLHPIFNEQPTEPVGLRATQELGNGDQHIVETTSFYGHEMRIFEGNRIVSKHHSPFVTEHVIFKPKWAGLKMEARKLFAFLRPGWR